MLARLAVIVLVCPFLNCPIVRGQQDDVQHGLFYKAGTNVRLSGIKVRNRRSAFSTTSNFIGAFTISALPGDTLEVKGTGYENIFFAAGPQDKLIFLQPQMELPEVIIKENTVTADLDATKHGYRKMGVFYTGTPHYYYLFLKPMTFIYENFKSEVIEARRFKRFANDERAYLEINARFNENAIKKLIPINDGDIDDFAETYWPTVKQIRSWNDYDLDNYIIRSYGEFKAKHSSAPKS
jgi:hypothetical protein